MSGEVASWNLYYLFSQVAGASGKSAADELAKVDGVKRVLHVNDTKYDDNLSEPLAALIVSAQEKEKFTHILAGASAIGKVCG